MKIRFLLLLLILAAALPAQGLDGELVYKNNCTRCHIAMPSFGPKTTRVIVRHMRVRALLTQPEADAVMSFLSGRAPASIKK